MNREFFTIRTRNKTAAKFDLLTAILPALGSPDRDVRADAAARLTDLLTLMDLKWEAVAYLIARGERSANAAAAALLPASFN